MYFLEDAGRTSIASLMRFEYQGGLLCTRGRFLCSFCSPFAHYRHAIGYSELSGTV